MIDNEYLYDFMNLYMVIYIPVVRNKYYNKMG